MSKVHEVDEPITGAEIKYVLDTQGLSRGARGARSEVVMLEIINEFFITKKGCRLTITTESTETIFVRTMKGRVCRKVKLIPT